MGKRRALAGAGIDRPEGERIENLRVERFWLPPDHPADYLMAGDRITPRIYQRLHGEY